MLTLGNTNHIGFGFGARNENLQVNNQGALRTCTYKDFISFKPRTLFGNEGVVGLTRWIEKTESMFEINSCLEECMVKFVAYTFVDVAMSWWNSHVNTMGLVSANAISWEQLKQMLIEEYFPREEMHQLEKEL